MLIKYNRLSHDVLAYDVDHVVSTAYCQFLKSEIVVSKILQLKPLITSCRRHLLHVLMRSSSGHLLVVPWVVPYFYSMVECTNRIVRELNTIPKRETRQGREWVTLSHLMRVSSAPRKPSHFPLTAVLE